MLEDNVKYLRDQKAVVIPSTYTFWVHNAYYKLPENRTEGDNGWDEIPIKGFYVEEKLKCQRAFDMVLDAFKNKENVFQFNNDAPKNALPFSIIIIQPRHDHLNDIFEKSELKLRQDEEVGLGDFSGHPKIVDGTHFIVFACRNRNDEIGRNDIIYAIREEDVDDYVKELKNIQESGIKIEKSKEYWGFETDKEQGVVRETGLIKTLACNCNFARFEDIYVGKPGQQVVMPAPYKQDLINSCKNKIDENIDNDNNAISIL